MLRFPIEQETEAIVAALSTHNRLVVEAPTGSGKSTQIPQILLDRGLAGSGRIVVLQPRRLPARMLARWVAAQRGVPLGDEVGYRVRLENRAGPRTRILYETEGMLVRQMLSDPRLSDIAVIVFDEFHERHVHADMMLPLALALQEDSRPELKVVVMSATLGSARLAAYLAPCAQVVSEGRSYPVEIRHLDQAPGAQEAPWDLAAEAYARARREGLDGDTLIFMPGAYEIRRTIEALQRQGSAGRPRCFPLHGELSPSEQDAALTRLAEPRVVVATNVAETSLTIDGIVLVIDSGLARKAAFDPARGINTLMVGKICQAAADQRAGRAGRTGPGRCLRLWTVRDQAARPAQETPEIQRVDTAEVILLLKRLGQATPETLRWLDAPRPEALAQGLQLLRELGALDAREALTPLGLRLADMPTHPRHGRMLLAGAALGCLRETALIAAMSQERGILLGRQNRAVLEARDRILGEERDSDLLRALRAWDYARAQDFRAEACAALGIQGQAARRVGALANQLTALLAKTQDREPPEDPAADANAIEAMPREEAVRRAVLAGFPDQLASLVSLSHRRYALTRRRRGTLDKESVVDCSSLLVATEIHEIGQGRGEVELRLSQVTAVTLDWLREGFADALRFERAVHLDGLSKQIAVRRQTWFRDLLVEDAPGGEATPDEAAAILTAEVLNGRMALKLWDHKVEQWIARVNLVAGACPELAIPAIGTEARRLLIEQICLGARGPKDLRDQPVWPILRGWLEAAQQRVVEAYAPERVKIANGREPRITYEEGKPPSIAMRIQELYDVEAPITIARGRVRVLVQVLAPNQRPVQITDDLGSFWKNSYAQVRKDLRGRYPRHEWR